MRSNRNDRHHGLGTVVSALALLGVFFVALPGFSQEAGADAETEAAEPLLALEAVSVRGPVEGKAPTADSLVRLSVRIANRGEEIASAFAFTVTVAGHELPVYAQQVFLKPVPPGESVDLALYNFWTSETGRPAPADGKLTVAVSLREATWMRRTVEEEVEVWRPLGAVEGLPVATSTVVTLGGGS